MKHNIDFEEEKELEPVNKKLVQNYIKLPKKSDYRTKAHVNPLGDMPFPCPPSPDNVDWSIHYPLFFGKSKEENLIIFDNTVEREVDYSIKKDDKINGSVGPCVEIIDCGCGYGNLLLLLSEIAPQKLILGMEIRSKVVTFVAKKISALRNNFNHEKYGNVWALHSNVMKGMTSYFRKGQIEKMFFCYPDPHFKKSNYRRRIINPNIISEYAYVLKIGGKIYTVSDVKECFDWNVFVLSKCRLFKRVEESQLVGDIFVDKMVNCTDEAKKVEKKKGEKYFAVFERIEPINDSTYLAELLSLKQL